jgi:uncharacterized protein (DUF1684 family)
MEVVKKSFVFLVIVLLVFTSCKTEKVEEMDASYIESIENYRVKRLERLKSPTGWLNLAGLLWLKNGENTVGSDILNTIIFPEKAEQYIGKLILDDSTITFYPHNKNLEIKINDTIFESKILHADANGKPDFVKHGDFGWYVIKRGDKYGIRLRDYKSPMLDKLDSIPAYAINPVWKVNAKFVKLDEERKVKVPTVIGTEEDYKVTGLLEFKIGGKKHTLTPFESKNGFFLIFADETSQDETYPAGRFLYCDAPDEDENVIIDFNKAYNPPCAFTPFATCPLPPRENILSVAIKAGEKNVHVYDH